jgi:hypothetical protein
MYDTGLFRPNREEIAEMRESPLRARDGIVKKPAPQSGTGLQTV